MSMKAFGATVTGKSHLLRGAGCEDAVSIVSDQDGRWISAVLCDGCGSSRHAADGAAHASTFLAKALAGLAGRLDRDGPGEWVIDHAVTLVAALREEMRTAYGPDLRDHSATLLAAMVSERGGFVMHLGDGVATAFVDSSEGKITVEAAVQSDPQNGEYANQTYYFTEPDWVKNIRITPLSAPALVLLCTDGAQDVLYRGNAPIAEVIVAMLHGCLAEQLDPVQALEDFLLSEAAAKLSNDDKGCVVIFTPLVAAMAARRSLRVAPVAPSPAPLRMAATPEGIPTRQQSSPDYAPGCPDAGQPRGGGRAVDFVAENRTKSTTARKHRKISSLRLRQQSSTIQASGNENAASQAIRLPVVRPSRPHSRKSIRPSWRRWAVFALAWSTVVAILSAVILTQYWPSQPASQPEHAAKQGDG